MARALRNFRVQTAFKFANDRADTREEMDSFDAQTHFVKRVVLPSGKTI